MHIFIRLTFYSGGDASRPFGSRGETPRRPNSQATPARSATEIKDGISSAKDGAPERTIQREVT